MYICFINKTASLIDLSLSLSLTHTHMLEINNSFPFLQLCTHDRFFLSTPSPFTPLFHLHPSTFTLSPAMKYFQQVTILWKISNTINQIYQEIWTQRLSVDGGRGGVGWWWSKKLFQSGWNGPVSRLCVSQLWHFSCFKNVSINLVLPT